MSRVAMMVRVDDRPAPLPAIRALFFCVVGISQEVTCPGNGTKNKHGGHYEM